MRKLKVVPIVAALSVGAVLMMPSSLAFAAAPNVQDHYDNVFDIVVPTADDPPGSTFCGLVGVAIHGEEHGYFSIQTRGNSAFPYFADRLYTSYTYTNPETGLSLTVNSRGAGKDLHVVDNGDGTLTITGQFAGIQRSYGPDGELLFPESGLFRQTVIVDYNGTIDPDDDEFLSPVGEPMIAGPHPTDGRDFCADFRDITSA